MAKVMLVEDDNNLREIYEARLQAEGYVIVSAHDGEEALVVAKAEKPDLIISDVMMPKISGFEMLDILRNTDGLKDVKIIMLTALGQADDQQRADKLGADRYLVKSQVTLEDIVKTAHELLGEDAEPAAPDTPPSTLTGTETAGSAAAPTAAPAPATIVQPGPAPAAAPASPPTATAPVVTDTSAPASQPASAAAAAQPQPEPAAKPNAPPVADDKAAKTAADDKVMAAAVDSLVADTEKKDEPTKAPTEKVIQPTTTPGSEQENTKSNSIDNATDTSADDSDIANGHVKIANKKVITPIDSQPEKDIHALLAEEEAREASQTPGTIADPSLSAAEAAVKQDATTSTAQEEAGMEAKIEDFVTGATTEPSAPPAAQAGSADAAKTSSQSAEEAAKNASSSTTPADAPDQPATQQDAPATPAASSTRITPIVVSEDMPSGAPAGSLSGNPGAPPAASSAPNAKTPTDPNNIAL